MEFHRKHGESVFGPVSRQVSTDRQAGANLIQAAQQAVAPDGPCSLVPREPGPQLTGQVQPPALSSSRGSTRSARMNLLYASFIGRSPSTRKLRRTEGTSAPVFGFLPIRVTVSQ